MIMTEKLRWQVSTVALPVLYLSYLYRLNASFLSSQQTILMALGLMLVYLGLFTFYDFIFHKPMLSFITCVLNTFLLAGFSHLYQHQLIEYAFKDLIWIILPILSFCLTAFLHSRIDNNRRQALSAMVLILVMALTVYNSVAAVWAGLKVNQDGTGTRSSQQGQEPVLDLTTATPDIYWFLCDGMLGFESMEKYFLDSQDTLRQELQTRGFFIGDTARLEAHHFTRIAVPALMSPDFYDDYLERELANPHSTVQHGFDTTRLQQARIDNELFKLFSIRGYTTIIMSVDENIFFPTTDYFYYLPYHNTSKAEQNKLPQFVVKSDQLTSDVQVRQNVRNLGYLTLGNGLETIYDLGSPPRMDRKPVLSQSNLPMDQIFAQGQSQVYASLFDCLQDSFINIDQDKPRLTLIHSFITHFPYIFDETGQFINVDYSPDRYPAQHRLAAKIHLLLIDQILARQPDAVIVMTGDHGLHGLKEEKILNRFQDSEAVDGLWNNIFYALRIPSQYRNGEEAFAYEEPLNLARFLVNQFVGVQYKYRMIN